MDAKPQNPALEELIRRNEQARNDLAQHWHDLRHRLDLPARLQDNIRNNRTAWFAGSAACGLIASSFLRRKAPAPTIDKPSRKGLLGLALGTAFTLAKPALKGWLLSELQKRLIPRKSPPPRF